MDALIAWSAQSAPVVGQLSVMMATLEETLEALKSPEISRRPNDSPRVDYDGLGVRFLFSYLASVAAVAREAHESERSLIFVQSYD